MKTRANLHHTPWIFIIFCFLYCYNLSAQTGDMSERSLVKTADDSSLQWGPCPEFMPEGCGLTVLHGDPSKKNSDVLIKLPANSKIANHRHTSAERMILLSGEMEVTYKGEDSQILTTGSYAYGPANKPHSAKCNEGPCILFIAFEEPVDAVVVND